MNGVEILSSAQIASEFAFSWLWFWIGFGIVFVMSMLLGIGHVITGECEWWLILVCLVLGIIGGVVFGGALGSVAKTPTAYEAHYKVAIDDSFSMNEFLDKYEILDQEGKIYTVKEKTK